jgi:putative phosphoesterase
LARCRLKVQANLGFKVIRLLSDKKIEEESAMNGKTIRIALFSDVHGNLTALNAVISELEKEAVDRHIFLGDVVDWGPFPRECLKVLCDFKGIMLIRGNHESYMLEQEFPAEKLAKIYKSEMVENFAWTYAQINESDRQLMRQFEPHIVEQIDGMQLSFIHASLNSDEHFVNQDVSDSEMVFRLGTYDLCAYGHIHKQFEKRFENRVYINPGSVGLPLDGDPRAAYAILIVSRDGVKVELKRVKYDYSVIVDAMRDEDTPYRKKLESVLQKGSS